MTTMGLLVRRWEDQGLIGALTLNPEHLVNERSKAPLKRSETFEEWQNLQTVNESEEE